MFRPQGWGGQSNLCQHASPSDDVRIDGFAVALLMARNSLEETVQVFVGSVIVFIELVESVTQKCADGGRIVPFQGRVAQLVSVGLVIGEAGEFLKMREDLSAAWPIASVSERGLNSEHANCPTPTHQPSQALPLVS